jgi:serine/threonine protein kinase
LADVELGCAKNLDKVGFVTFFKVCEKRLLIYNTHPDISSSYLFVGKWKNVPVTVKVLKPGQMSAKTFLEKTAIMTKLRHHLLVSMFGVCAEKEPIYIICEYMSKGSLLEYLKKDGKTELSVRDLIYIALQVFILFVQNMLFKLFYLNRFQVPCSIWRN